jgi:hypothetical protein
MLYAICQYNMHVVSGVCKYGTTGVRKYVVGVNTA